MPLNPPNLARPVPMFPPLIVALDQWRRADDAFNAAGSQRLRGIAMVGQLRARAALHRLTEIEGLLENPLRKLLVEEGVWSAGEALERLAGMDFSQRAASLRMLAPILSGEWLGSALEMAKRHCWGDDTRWRANEDLIQALIVCLSSPGSGKHDPKGLAATRSSSPEDAAPLATSASNSPSLTRILLGCRATDEDRWLEPSVERLLDYIEKDLLPEHVAELAKDRGAPLFIELRRALIGSDREFWSTPWFRSVFDAVERKEHLRRVVARREEREVAWDDRSRGLLQIARRLGGPRRSTVLRWAAALRERGRIREMATDLARMAELAEGSDRARLVGKIESQFETLDAEEQLTVLVSLLKGATATEATALARRGFRTMSSGKTKIQDTIAFLRSLPSQAWTDLKKADWAPALGAGGGVESGWASHLRWIPYDPALLSVANLPEEARRLVETLGLPYLLAQGAEDRLRVAALSIHALSPAGRLQLTASLLALDAATWRSAGWAVAPIARALDDEDLERLSQIVLPPAAGGNARVEQGLAEAWAARRCTDRAMAIVERISDGDQRAAARIAVAVVAADIAALPLLVDPRLIRRAFSRPDGVVPWLTATQGSVFADALATRLDDGSCAAASLEVWAALWPALSPAMQAHLAARIELAVEAVIAGDDREDDSLCAIGAVLPARLLERIWRGRAFAPAYRHALTPFEARFCDFMLAGHHQHPGVLHVVQALGGDDALLDHARWLAGDSAELTDEATGSAAPGA